MTAWLFHRLPASQLRFAFSAAPLCSVIRFPLCPLCSLFCPSSSGCSVPQISVLTVLWYTVLFLLGAGVLLILASALYAITRGAQVQRRVNAAPSKKLPSDQPDAPLQIRSDSESAAITPNPAAGLRDSSAGASVDSSAPLPPLHAQPSSLTRLDSTLGPAAPTRRVKVWKRRAQNSLTVLGVVIYLQLSSQILRCLFCVEIQGKSVLQVEPTTGQSRQQTAKRGKGKRSQRPAPANSICRRKTAQAQRQR